MARIRTIKPEFFRHEKLQDLEHENPGACVMLVFAGLWTQCDGAGRFRWQPRQLKLDILPFLVFDMEATLELLRAAGLVNKYSVNNEYYGEIPTFGKHQRLTGKEAEYPERFPAADSETSGKQRRNSGETTEKQQGDNVEIPVVHQCPGKGKGKGKGKELRARAREAPPPPSKKSDPRSRSFEDAEDSSEPEDSNSPNANTPPGLDPNLAAPMFLGKTIPITRVSVSKPIDTLDGQVLVKRQDPDVAAVSSSVPEAAARSPDNGAAVVTREFLKTDPAVRAWISAVIGAWNAEAGIVGPSMPRAHDPPNVNLELALFAWWQDEKYRQRYEDAIRKVGESQWVRTEKRGGVSLEWLARRQRYVDVLDGKYAEFMAHKPPPKKQVVYKDL